jgi:hypothetical protein
MEGTSGPGVGSVTMLVHDAGVGIMICGVGVLFCESVGVAFVVQEEISSRRKKRRSLFIFSASPPYIGFFGAQE